MEKPIPELRVSIVQLECTKCGAEARAACSCGVAYQAKAQRAAEAVAAHPEMSNRAIASQIGADEKTVRKARSGADQSAPETVTGRDGKTYSLEHGRKQVIELQKHYGETYSLPPIQYDLLEQVKPTIKQMNRPTKEALAMWLGEIYRD